VTIGDLVYLDAKGLDETFRPFAIVGPGSFSEWFEYGRDASWRRDLDHWMELVRTTGLPMLSICGSHQLVAIAFNGFGAVGHMHDDGPPPTIEDDFAVGRGTWAEPRVGEEGTYPVVATQAGLADPVVQAVGTAPMVSQHHKDLVIDTRGFVVLYEGDTARMPATSGRNQAKTRCRVQAMKLDDPKRLLYSVQFHPEIGCFSEGTMTDQGFGTRFLCAFLDVCRAHWSRVAAA
jgi:GMP synthase-like glutamine amidotransferase